MTGGSHIVAIGGDEDASEGQEESVASVEDALALEEEWAETDEYYEEDAPNARSWTDWIVPVLAMLMIAGWTGIFAFVNQAEMLSGASLTQWTAWISQWAMPVALIVGVWLLAMRTSTREQARFADTSRLLADESAGLEAKLREVNRELSMARDFIASQSRDLETLGRTAAERLSENAETLSGLIEENGERIDSISNVSTTALENMGKLRDDLPVISNSARDVTNQIGNAGRTAKSQIDEMVAGFKRLNEFGAASDEQVKAVQKHASFALSQLTTQTDQLGKLAEQRFTELSEQSQAFRAELDGHEVEALAAIRRRAEALSEELSQLQADFAEQEEQSATQFRKRLQALREESGAASRSIRDGENKAAEAWRNTVASVDTKMAAALERMSLADSEAVQRSADHLAKIETHANQIDALLAAHGEAIDASIAQRTLAIDESKASLEAVQDALSSRLDDLAAKSAEVSELGEKTTNDLGEAVEQLRGKFEAGREALEGTDVVIAGLTDASVRLLELIQASAQHSEEILPSAIHNAQATIERFKEQASDLTDAVETAEAKASAAAESFESAKSASASSLSAFEQFETAHNAQLEQRESSLLALQAKLNELDERGEFVTKKLNDELEPAALALQEALTKALDSVELNSASQIAKITDKAGEESAATIEKVIKERSAAAIAELEAAAASASTKSREATKQMRDQLAMVAELTSNLESRVAHARSLAQEQVDNDFARRVALITESLNSHAIDLSRAMSTDVTDTAWASYLKGDRGIFTRRAVSLLENDESREIYDIYESDPDFREHVSRYIHDFEAMLRTLLSTRDGKAISVTLLSSDMGKLYVALAQAIERLRT